MIRLLLRLKGGAGSGHRGHSGRPGKRGGSTGGTGGDSLGIWKEGVGGIVWTTSGESRVIIGKGAKGWYVQPSEKGLSSKLLRRSGFDSKESAMRDADDWLRLCGPLRWKVTYDGKDLKRKSVIISAKGRHAAQRKVELGKVNFFRHGSVERPKY